MIGGVQTPERLERAAAPWFSPEGGREFQVEVVRAMAEGGELDGALGVFATAGDKVLLNDTVLPLLDELGIEPVEVAINDAAADDVAAANAQTAVIAERFEASGVDQVLVLGTAGLTWASGVESLDYRPPLRLTDPNSILAYTGDQARRDLSVLDGAVAGNLYGGPENLWTMDNMQACIERVEAGGGSVPEPDTVTEEGADPLGGRVHCVPQRRPARGTPRGGRGGPELRVVRRRGRGPRGRRPVPARALDLRLGCRRGRRPDGLSLRLRPGPHRRVRRA